eukprot:TRINITY_DN14954_c0_g1_i1.p1 TRINITY_DN14954_c0_g1~~TRINITY_DN14954_c0_g1_i1.p1  ORF type:complete len:448 (+),score=134.54 TRINITY_DN14954_c0_g1_i1:210-1553(+)
MKGGSKTKSENSFGTTEGNSTSPTILSSQRYSSSIPIHQLSPQLVITRQNSLTVEKHSKNGIVKQVHVVVKNQPFIIRLGFNSMVLDTTHGLLALNRTSVEAALFYDCDPLKEVNYIKLKPLEYKCLNDEYESPSSISVEIRLKVLSSQLEDMFFRIVFYLVNPLTHQRINGMMAISDPIKVVSKPDLAKKKGNATITPTNSLSSIQSLNINSNNSNSIMGLSSTFPPLPTSGSISTPSPNKARSTSVTKSQVIKPSSDELLALALARIESSCVSQKNSLSRLLQQPSNSSPVNNSQFDIIPPSFQFDDLDEEDLWNVSPQLQNKKQKMEEPPSKEALEFSSALQQFLTSYEGIEEMDRPARLRKIARSTLSSQHVVEDLLTSIGIQINNAVSSSTDITEFKDRVKQENLNPDEHPTVCKCSDCPFRAEVQRIDEFYTEMLSNNLIL